MAVTTYLVRVLPMTIIRGEIKNQYLKSFLHYVPFATISSMILPGAFTSTDYVWSGLAGLVAAFYLSYKEKDLVVIAFWACAAVFITEFFLGLE